MYHIYTKYVELNTSSTNSFDFESSVFKFIVRPSKSALVESPTIRKVSSTPSYIGNHRLSSPVSEFWPIRTIHIPMHKDAMHVRIVAATFSSSAFFVQVP